MSNEITEGWFKFAADCNRDSGYPGSHQAGLDRSKLAEQWQSECPGLEVPQVLLSNETGKYELVGLSIPKK